MEGFIHGHSRHTPYPKILEEIKKLEGIQKRRELDKLEQDDLAAYLEYKEKYERDYESMGEGGAEAYRFWSLLDGQRKVGFAEIGEIEFSAMEFVFRVYEIEKERWRELFELILAIDRMMMKTRRQKPAESTAKNLTTH